MCPQGGEGNNQLRKMVLAASSEPGSPLSISPHVTNQPARALDTHTHVKEGEEEAEVVGKKCAGAFFCCCCCYCCTHSFEFATRVGKNDPEKLPKNKVAKP